MAYDRAETAEDRDRIRRINRSRPCDRPTKVKHNRSCCPRSRARARDKFIPRAFIPAVARPTIADVHDTLEWRKERDDDFTAVIRISSRLRRDVTVTQLEKHSNFAVALFCSGLASGAFIFLAAAPRRARPRICRSLSPLRCLRGNRFTVLRRANHPPREFRQPLATAAGPDEKESRMLNRAFYGYGEFALFRARPGVVLIDLVCVHGLLYDPPVFLARARARWICSAQNREMLIVDCLVGNRYTLTMHCVWKRGRFEPRCGGANDGVDRDRDPSPPASFLFPPPDRLRSAMIDPPIFSYDASSAARARASSRG